MSASAVGSAGMSENRRARRRFAAIAALGAVQRRPLPDRGADADAMLRPGQTDPVIWVSRRTRGPERRADGSTLEIEPVTPAHPHVTRLLGYGS